MRLRFRSSGSRCCPRSWLAIIAISLSCGSTFAQECPSFLYREAWVDPFYGTDPGVVDDPSFPFLTLNAAIAALASHPDVVNRTHDGLVHAMPGLYSFASNGELFPVTMRDFVHLQGVGAKECVIRGLQTDNPFELEPYWPLATGIERQLRVILVDWTLTTGASEPSFDGFTLQGGDIQVYAETEFPTLFGRVSNCVFDLRGTHEVLSPSFGILMVNIFFGEPEPYRALAFNILNNTFIQGFRFGADPEDIEVAMEDNVAICDVNDPSPPCGFPQCLEDPDPTQRGVSPHNIQNNLIRALPEARRTALLGIDNSDVIAFDGSAFRPTNAFDGEAVGGLSMPNGTFASAIVGATPVPFIDLMTGDPVNIRDPGFVGEMIASRHLVPVRDWRLLPDSLLVDQGLAPIYDPEDPCTGLLVAENGHTYVDHPRFGVGPDPWLIGSFDFDGDVHGNFRIVNGLQPGEPGAAPDIGFDEVDVYLVSEAYGNDTKSHNLPWDPNPALAPFIPVGTPDRSMIFLGPATIDFHYTFVAFAIPVIPSWTNMPGSLAIPVFFPARRELWLDPAILDQPFGPRLQNQVVPAAMWVNWIDGTLHTFGELRATREEPGAAPGFFNQQVLYDDGVIRVLSNLQSEYL